MRVTESRIIVLGDGEIVTWQLPAGDHILNAQETIKSSVQTTTVAHLAFTKEQYAAISPDLNYIIGMKSGNLFTCNMHTGKSFDGISMWQPGFSLDGNRVWNIESSGKVIQWALIKDGESSTIDLEYIEDAEELLRGFPWHSTYGYQVTDDGWILSPGGRHLLWLPHQWWSKVERRWGRKFLVLLCSKFLEVVTIELEV